MPESARGEMTDLVRKRDHHVETAMKKAEGLDKEYQAAEEDAALRLAQVREEINK